MFIYFRYIQQISPQVVPATSWNKMPPTARAVSLALALGLCGGLAKGRFVLSKTALRNKRRLQRLENARPWQVFAPGGIPGVTHGESPKWMGYNRHFQWKILLEWFKMDDFGCPHVGKPPGVGTYGFDDGVRICQIPAWGWNMLKLGFVAGFYPLIILMMGTSVALKKVFGTGFGGGMVTGQKISCVSLWCSMC